MNDLSFIDLISIISFCVGLQNLDLNISQENLDNQTQELDGRLRANVADIHEHLKQQDEKIDKIIDMIEVLRNDKN